MNAIHDAMEMLTAIDSALRLLPESIRKELPPPYSTGEQHDPLALVRFHSPASGWQWFGIEFDGEDRFYGLVKGFEEELGYFSLSELAENGIERDTDFEPTRLSALLTPDEDNDGRWTQEDEQLSRHQ